MKRHGNIFEQIISLDNLRAADAKARRGKQSTAAVRVFDRDREANLLRLHQALAAGTYKPSAYSTFVINKPKQRTIYKLPYYPDRIVHHAIMLQVVPIWMPLFDRDTYCGIPGRGIHAAAKRLQGFLRRDPQGTRYCLKIDIRKFYPSIDHDALKELVRWKIKDARALRLIDDLIDSTDGGIPIGNHTSIFFALLYFAKFLRYLRHECGVKYVIDYADDIVILHHDKAFLHGLLADIERYLATQLHLAVNPSKQVFPVAIDRRDRHGRGIDFLGYVFYKHQTRLRKGIKQRLARYVHKAARRPISRRAFRERCAAWWGWCKHADTANLITKLNNLSRYDINF